jgi:hypothetical protein
MLLMAAKTLWTFANSMMDTVVSIILEVAKNV